MDKKLVTIEKDKKTPAPLEKDKKTSAPLEKDIPGSLLFLLGAVFLITFVMLYDDLSLASNSTTVSKIEHVEKKEENTKKEQKKKEWQEKFDKQQKTIKNLEQKLQQTLKQNTKRTTSSGTEELKKKLVQKESQISQQQRKIAQLTQDLQKQSKLIQEYQKEKILKGIKEIEEKFKVAEEKIKGALRQKNVKEKISSIQKDIKQTIVRCSLLKEKTLAQKNSDKLASLAKIWQKRLEQLQQLFISREVEIHIKEYFANQELYNYGTGLIDTFYLYLRIEVAEKAHVLDFIKGKNLYKEQKPGENHIKIEASMLQLIQMEIHFVDADGDVDAQEIDNDDILETIKFDASFLNKQKQITKSVDKKEKFKLNVYIEKLDIPKWLLQKN